MNTITVKKGATVEDNFCGKHIVKEDFEASLKLLNEFGIIILHDTDPISEKYLDKGYCGDSYKMLNWLETNHPEMSVITLPISEAGLTIIKRSNDRRVNKFLK